MKKTFTFVLAMLMCLSVMVSCGTSGNTESTGGDTTTAEKDTASIGNAPSADTTTTTVAETENPYDVNGYLKDDLDPALNYNGEEFTILYWSDVGQAEFEVESQTGDLIKDALYKRNSTVEERLGIKFVWVGTPGDYNDQAAYVSQVTNDVNSGGEYDVFAGYSLTAATIALQGYSRDLLELQHLSFDQPWWPPTLTELTTIKDRLYFCSGDISTNLIHYIYCTFFNKDLAQELQIDDMYEVVNSGKWTLDKMAELAAVGYSDLNGDTAKDAGDRFGLAITTNVYFDPFFMGAGLRTVSKDAQGNLVMAEEFSSEKTQRVLEKVVNMFHESNYAASPATVSNFKSSAFAESRVLFLVDVFRVTSTATFADSTVSYGVLPLPKLEETQENYYTGMGFPYTLYSVSTALDDAAAQRAGAVLECMASESYRQVTPAVYEMTMKLKYASGESDADMYDLIRESVQIDIGRVFCTPLKNIPYTVFRNACVNGSTNWTSLITAEGKVFSKILTQITEQLDELPKS